MNMRFYTNEQVHQIVDQLLLQFDEAAPGPEPAHLNNDIPQQSSPENKVTLTVSEAAELIGISKPSMYEVVRTGKVRSVKVGKKILISRQSLMDWLKKGENYGAEACSRRRKSEKKKQWHLGGPGHPGHRFQDGQADQQERLRPHSEGVLGEDESAAGHRRRAGGYPTCRSQGATQARPEDVITVGQWLDTWLKEYLADVKPNTALQYESVVRLHLKPAFGDVLLKDLRTPMIQKFYNKMRDDGVSPKYIKNIHGILHRALDMAMRVEYLTKNPSTYTIRPKVVEKPVVPLDAPEQKKLFEALKGNPFETLFLTATFTGMRIGELIGLTWDCVDFENEVIYVEKQLVQTRKKGQKYRFGTLKNGKTRVIAPAPYIMQVLKKHKIAQAEQRLLMGDLWNPGEFPNLVFTHKDGSHYSQPTIWKEFQDILAAAGLEHHRVHDLRHTFAVNSLRAGDDIKTLQENMGHYSAAFTLDRYGHVTDTMRRESANRMQAFIENM